jgi:phenylacetate-CoA ligase
MNKLAIYYKVPHPIKTLSASTWGFYLRALRYGGKFNQLVEETLQRDTWNKRQWETWQQDALARMLCRAATTVPYYRQLWEERRRKGDKASWEILDNWPILEKEKVRNNPQLFISEISNRKHLFVDHTGGTTGKPTLIYESRESIRQMYALHEARTRRWFGVDRHHRWGMLGGQKIIPLDQHRPPYWVSNSGLKQVYFSVFHIKPETAKYYVDALWKYRPTHLVVYPSACAILAKFMLEQGLQAPEIKVVICNSESTLPKYRELMRRAFNCPVIDTYGMAEMCVAASECQKGTKHYWPDTGIIEVYDSHNKEYITDGGKTGDYVLTGLLNHDMPLIRYSNNDIGCLPDWQDNCTCGSSLPSLAGISGRSNDLILTKDDRELYILDTLYNDLPVVEGQLIQYSIDKFEVNVIPDEEYSRDTVLREITVRLRKYLGDVDLVLTEVEEIEKNPNGKVKPFISMINNQTYH